MGQLLGEIMEEIDSNDEGVASPLGVALVPINLKVVGPIAQKILDVMDTVPEIANADVDDVTNALIMAAGVLVATTKYDHDMAEAFAEMLSRTASVVTSTSYAAKQVEEPEPTDSEVDADTEITPVS